MFWGVKYKLKLKADVYCKYLRLRFNGMFYGGKQILILIFNVYGLG